jgi:hypothetical protein
MAFRIRAPMTTLALLFLGALGGLRSPLMAQRLTPDERAQRCNEIQAARDKAHHEMDGVKNQLAVFYRDLGIMQAFHDNPQSQISFLDHQIAPLRERTQSIRGKPTTTSEAEDIVELNTWSALRSELTIQQTIKDPSFDIGKDKNAYPTYLKKMQDDLTTRIGNLDRDASTLSCSQQSAPAAAPSNSSNNTGSGGSTAGTGSDGQTVRVKVITTVSCSASDAAANGLGSVMVEFHKLKPDGTLDSSAPLTVTTAGDGTTPDSSPPRIPPGSYTVQVGPEFGNLAWVNLHIVQNPGNGDRYNYDAKMGGASVTLIPIEDPNDTEEYQLAVRLTSSQACN